MTTRVIYYFGSGEGIHLILRICVATVTITLRFACVIYLLSDLGSSSTRDYTKIKTGINPVKILVAAKGFGPLTKGL